MNFKDAITNNTPFILSFVTILVIGSVAIPALAHKGAIGIVKERMDYFNRNKDNLKAIRGYLKKEDYQSIKPLALEIRDWAGKMHEYFPEGSGGSPSEASLTFGKTSKALS